MKKTFYIKICFIFIIFIAILYFFNDNFAIDKLSENFDYNYIESDEDKRLSESLAANSFSGNKVCSDGKYIYTILYCDFMYEYEDNYTYIYKKEIGTNDMIPLAIEEDVGISRLNIYLYKGKLYYNDFYGTIKSVSTDGENKDIIIDNGYTDDPDIKPYFYIYNDSIFYQIVKGNRYQIFKTDLDGNNKTIVIDRIMPYHNSDTNNIHNYFIIYKGNIFFFELDDIVKEFSNISKKNVNNHYDNLYKYNLATGETVCISDNKHSKYKKLANKRNLFIFENKFYFLSDDKFYYMDLDGGNVKNVPYTKNIGSFQYVNMDSEWIYYLTPVNAYKLKRDNGELIRIYRYLEYEDTGICLAENNIYIYNMNTHNFREVSTDGSYTYTNFSDITYKSDERGFYIYNNFKYSQIVSNHNDTFYFKVIKSDLNDDNRSTIIDHKITKYNSNTYFKLYKDNIYYAIEDELFKYSLITGKTICISTDEYREIGVKYDCIMFDDKLYFLSDHKLYYMDLDGNNVEPVPFTKNIEMYDIRAVDDNWIYYNLKYGLYKIKIDGSETIRLY